MWTEVIPHLVAHDAGTLHNPDPLTKVKDTIQMDLETRKIIDLIRLDTGNLHMVTGGANWGRTGVITVRETHSGSFNIVHSNGNSFATQLTNILLLEKATSHRFILSMQKVSVSLLFKREMGPVAKQNSG